MGTNKTPNDIIESSTSACETEDFVELGLLALDQAGKDDDMTDQIFTLEIDARATYGIEDGHGTWLAEGVSGVEVGAVARRLAAERGTSVYISEYLGPDPQDGSSVYGAPVEARPRPCEIDAEEAE